MRYISLFSGIEAASVAWEPLGFEPVAFSEVDPFCNEVLALRFPNVPNLGDISRIDWRPYHGKVDVIVGGSPCQSFSVAGRRAGLLDDRGALMLEYVRAIREVGPVWSIWENVPGVLSQDKGRAFATLQRELEDCGYSLAWRVLDAQFFGVAQRRRRVFLVGHADPRCAAAVLFERESLLGNFKSSKEARAHFTAASRTRAEETGGSIAEKPASLASSESSKVLELYENHGKDARIKGPMPTCPTITALYGTGGNNTPLVNERGISAVSYALVGNIIGRKPENGGNGSGYSEELCYTLTTLDHHAVCHAIPCEDAHTASNRSYVESPFSQFKEGEVGTLRASGGCLGGGSETLISESDPEERLQPSNNRETIRRLTPVECERLQGFPDNWTRIEWNGKPEEQCPDSRRYKALGNSMAVPVMRWIGQRMELVDRLSKLDANKQKSNQKRSDE